MKFLILLVLLGPIYSFAGNEINLYENYYDYEYNLEDLIKENQEMWECFARSGDIVYNGVHPVQETARYVAVTRCGYLSERPDNCVFVECKPYEFQN